MNYEILVNYDHRIPVHYLDGVEWVEVQSTDGELCKVEKVCYQHFCSLAQKMQEFGISLTINSAFRSIDEQKQLFEERIQEVGLEEALQYVAKPGYSEHHTGLAIDINIWSKEEKMLVKTDEYRDKILAKKEAEYAILHELLKQYGFILRFPKGKEEITKVSYEPWHIRYVGDLAKKIEDGMTLEEFYLHQKQLVNRK